MMVSEQSELVASFERNETIFKGGGGMWLK
jgi:hypothetical protein